MTKAAKIRRALTKGIDTADIAKKYGVPVDYVYSVKYKQKKGSESRDEVLKRTMPKKPSKLMMSVNEMNTALDALKLLGEEFKVTTRPFTKAEIAALDADTPDLVNHPPHYKAGGIETIDFIEAKDLNFRLGNVVKYVARAEKKGDPLEDLKKAKWYLEREIAIRERA